MTNRLTQNEVALAMASAVVRSLVNPEVSITDCPKTTKARQLIRDMFKRHCPDREVKIRTLSNLLRSGANANALKADFLATMQGKTFSKHSLGPAVFYALVGNGLRLSNREAADVAARIGGITHLLIDELQAGEVCMWDRYYALADRAFDRLKAIHQAHELNEHTAGTVQIEALVSRGRL